LLTAVKKAEKKEHTYPYTILLQYYYLYLKYSTSVHTPHSKCQSFYFGRVGEFTEVVAIRDKVVAF
jgi:hypothetical protein